jgi:hypothetical protein
MPRVLQPGGLLRNMCVHYTARRKLGLITLAKRIMKEEGVILRQAAKQLNISHSLFVRWRQQRAADVDPILAMLMSKRKAAHAGPLGQLKPLEQALVRHIFKHRKQGMTVHTFDLVVKASSLSPEFNAKDFVARCSAVKRFMCAHLLVYPMGMHETQRKPKEVAAEALDYMNLIRALLLGPHCDRHFILNMDQMPVYFCMTRKKTLQVVVVKTVHICTSTSGTKRATVAVTIATDGTVLPSTIVFKGKPDGRIAWTEFSTYPTTHYYHCQDSAWMDERVMLMWVDKVLKPYFANALEHVIPIRIPDSYHCHMMALIVTKFRSWE